MEFETANPSRPRNGEDPSMSSEEDESSGKFDSDTDESKDEFFQDSWISHETPTRAARSPRTAPYLDCLVSTNDASPMPNLGLNDSMKEQVSKTISLRKALMKKSTLEALEIEAAACPSNDEDESEEDDEELLRSTMDMFIGRPQHSIRRGMFRVLLGVSALLDFLSCISPALLRRNEDETDEESKSKPLYQYFFDKVADSVNKEGSFRDVFLWLDRYNTTFGIFFSLLWFAFAFSRARGVRMWILRERDKKRLLKDDKSSMKLERFDSYSSFDNTASSSATHWLGGRAWWVYGIMVGFQLLLLPVGFYLFSFDAIRAFFYNADADQTDAQPTCDTSTTFYAALSSKTQKSLGYAFFQHVGFVFSQMVKDKTKEEMRSRIKKLSRYLAKFAVRHPVRFRSNLKKALRLLRWAKYLAPLIGASNKLKGNMADLLKKYRQRREAYILHKCMQHTKKPSIKDLSEDEKRRVAPVVIQANWRASKKRREFRALKVFTRDTEMMAALRLQRQLRAALARARERLARKKHQLAALQDMERRIMKNEKGAHLSRDQRKRMYRLQEELNAAARKRQEARMLLRPNTRFAVIWKILFVLCVLIEITQLALKPRLDEYAKKHVKKGTKGAMDLQTVLHNTLVPTPTTEWDECAILEAPAMDIHTKKLGSRLFSFRTKKQRDMDLTPPWYCHKPYSTLHFAFISGLKFTLAETLSLIGVICFLDVFVTFFTGEIDPNNGALVPKPFFKRWILPGIILQLLVNPKMGEVAAFIKALIRGAHYVGPVQAWRWSCSLFVPVISVSVAWFERHVWRKFVKEENARV